MPVITFIQVNGESRNIDVPIGQNLMQVAIDHGIDGILGECGGAAMCATCHVYVATEWLNKVPSPDSNESSMLEFTTSDRQPNSRLSCQVRVTQALDGLVVHLPSTQ
jgi:2Fe-2S ferredoxin